MADLTALEVDNAIRNHDITKFNLNKAYFLGKNPSILNRQDREKPNFKVPVPIARKIVNGISGYMAKPGNISYIGLEESNLEYLNKVFEVNKEALLTFNLFTDVCVYGKAYELHYVANDIEQFARIPIAQCIPSYTNEIKPQIDLFIRYYSYIENGEENYFADVYYKDRVEKFNKKKINDKLSLFAVEPHYYEDVPVVEYKVNLEKTGVFDHVIYLIDQLDNVITDNYANELGRFADSYLLLSKNIDKLDAEKIKDLRIFDGLGSKSDGDFVEFLTKNINSDYTSNSADRFERLIYEQAQVPNFNDDSFNTSSGIAIEYKLIDFENLASSLEANFTIGLQRRIDLINNILSLKNENKIKVRINWQRNLPRNIVEIADVVQKLYGVLSKETLLKMFPKRIIEDVEKELLLIEQENELKINLDEEEILNKNNV